MTGAAAPVAPGDVIAGKYRVDRVLGAGGMGVVVAATHVQLDQKVALKFLLPEVVQQAEVVERFLREARNAVKIHSEHVSRVLDVGTLDTGAPYMVMELLEGQDLANVLETKGAISPAEAVGYVLQACEAIAEAHALGIVHRDLKPANLFLTWRPSGPPIVKVLDFGISKAPITAKERALTQAAVPMGSPAYMSPEQMKGARDVDARSDVWSLGVVLHELLTANLPFGGDSVTALITAVIIQPHIPLRKHRPDAPRGLEAVIDRCLEKDPDRRFADVAELAKALVPFGPPRCEQSLERIATVLSGTHARSGAQHRVIVGGGSNATGATIAVTSGTARSAASAKRAWIAIPAVLGVLLAAAGAYALLRGQPAKATAAPPADDRTASATAPPSATPAPSITAAPSATAVQSATAAPSATEAPSATATSAVHAHASAAGQAKPPAVVTAATAKAKPACKVVPFWDKDGEQHFRQECP